MCGRFALIASPAEIRALFHTIEGEDFPPRYNIAPSQPIACVLLIGTARHLRLMRWGLVPGFVKNPSEFRLLFNARGESVAEKPSFRAALRHRRCLVPASGFYEWQVLGAGKKQPFWIAPKSGGIVAFAGIYESWVGKEGEVIGSACIITAPSSPSLTEVHDRMPVVVEEKDFTRWLSNAPPAEIADIIAVPPGDLFALKKITTAVNAARNDGPELLKALA